MIGWALRRWYTNCRRLLWFSAAAWFLGGGSGTGHVVRPLSCVIGAMFAAFCTIATAFVAIIAARRAMLHSRRHGKIVLGRAARAGRLHAQFFGTHRCLTVAVPGAVWERRDLSHDRIGRRGRTVGRRLHRARRRTADCQRVELGERCCSNICWVDRFLRSSLPLRCGGMTIGLCNDGIVGSNGLPYHSRRCRRRPRNAHDGPKGLIPVDGGRAAIPGHLQAHRFRNECLVPVSPSPSPLWSHEQVDGIIEAPNGVPAVDQAQLQEIFVGAAAVAAATTATIRQRAAFLHSQNSRRARSAVLHSKAVVLVKGEIDTVVVAPVVFVVAAASAVLGQQTPPHRFRRVVQQVPEHPRGHRPRVRR